MKQRIRHLLSILLVCAMVLSLLPISVLAEEIEATPITVTEPAKAPEGEGEPTRDPEPEPIPEPKAELTLNIADGSISLGNGTYKQGEAKPVAIPEDGLVITGTSTENTITVDPGEGNMVAFIISGLTLETAEEKNLIDIQSGNVTLMLEGENSLSNKTGGEKASVRVSSSASLTINGTGNLNIYSGLEDGVHEANGAGIGGNFEESPKAITINGGTITVEQYGTSAAIGGGARADSGKISITGGEIDVTVLPAGGNIESAGTGIGGGGENIKDSSLIGSAGSADISITGGKITAHVESAIFDFGSISSGAAIGAGENKGGTIYIGGDADVHATAQNLACAIGSSNATWSSSGDNVFPPPEDPMNITIEGNAKVFAQTESLDFYGQGAYSGAAIGMSVQNLQRCSITIGGNADVTARGSWYGAGIGGSYVQINKQAQPINITIQDNAKVDASAEVYGAGIGSGYGDAGAESATIVIKDNPTIVAKGGWGGAGIGGAKGTQGGSITITGGDITAEGGVGGVDLFGINIGGAGIGAGAVDDSDGYGALAGDITIGGTAKVKAIGGTGSAGIGGGNLEAITTTGAPSVESRDDNGGGAESITITDTASVYAVGGKGASAIGSGATYDGAPAPITEKLIITDGTTVEAYADGAKFAIDMGNTNEGAVQVTDTVLNGRFAADETMPEDSKGNHPINLLKDDKVDAKLTLPAGYRAFAVTASDDSEGTIRIQNSVYSKRYAYYTEEDNSKQLTYPLYENKDADGTYFMLTKDELRWMPFVTIQPADITVYMGGDSYDKVVGEDGEIVTDQENGLPEPGFYVTLPDELNAELKKALGVSEDTVLDLSPYLSFHSGNKTWTLERYDGAETSIVNGKYIYRMSAGDGQDPVRMQFKGDDGSIHISDQLDLTKVLHNHYDMSIYPGAVDQTTVYAKIDTAKITANGGDVSKISYLTYAASAIEGKLTIRGVTQTGDSRPVKDKVDQPVTQITATAPNGTKYYVNDSKVEVVKGIPSLLVDEIIHTETSDKLLKDKALETLKLTASSKLNYDFRYLDLVDKSNGNTWITANNSIKVYWPYPKNTNQNTKFYLVHFEGLDREMDVEDLAGEVAKCNAVSVKIENTSQGIAFETSSFSPFVLVWSESSGGGGSTTDPDPKPEPKPDPDDTGVSDWLDTKDHRLYLVGYPDSTFRPERNMTRAEVAQMFYALLLDQDVAITTTFSDVADEAWYATAVKTLASLGMMDGYPDGTFRPDAPITRAEFATVALAFAYDPASASCSYTDVNANAWYYTYVAQATTYGWIGGYPDDSFRPNNSITRAEVAVIVNNMLGRDADERYIDRNADELVHFVDLSKNHWAYYTIMEATNSHDYTKASAGETWKNVR